MLHRFGTHEEAALFVSLKRSEGYYAEVLHENVAFLWCPLVMGGVAAWVSEEAAEEGDEVPDFEVEGPKLPWPLSFLALCLMLGVPAAGIVLFVFSLLRHGMDYPSEAGAILLGLLVIALCSLLALVILGWLAGFLSRWVHAYWDRTHQLHQHAVLVHSILALLVLLVATEFGGMVLWTLMEYVFFPNSY